MHPARLFIVCGLPGSGKTTRAEQLEERFGAVRMSADDWMGLLGIDVRDADVRGRLEAAQGDLVAPMLRAGTSIVAEWGSWSRAERGALRDIARTAGALVHLELLDAPVDVLWERVEARGRERAAGSRAITQDDLVEWSNLIERPTDDELSEYDPWPPIRAGERPGSPAYPYGNWQPRPRPR